MQSYLTYLGVGSSEGQQTANRFFREASLRLNEVVSATQFALGERPSLIDFCLFTGYYAHQYRDLGEAQRFLKAETPNLCYYIDNLHIGSCLPETGELAISDPLREYLNYIGPASSGFAQGVQKGTMELASGTASGEVLEQGFAPFEFDLGDDRFERGGSTFSYWKLQRARDVYRTLGADQKATANEILDETGWNDVLDDEPGFRLDRVDHQIRLA
ncbi:MAG: hypothetical protein HUJ31_07925 [Pseudomonadales bacterium]|nr:hypothetical protein [Pseudomonadales bacterium]